MQIFHGNERKDREGNIIGFEFLVRRIMEPQSNSPMFTNGGQIKITQELAGIGIKASGTLCTLIVALQLPEGNLNAFVADDRLVVLPEGIGLNTTKLGQQITARFKSEPTR